MKPNLVKAPSKLDDEFRHNTESFLNECCKHGDRQRPFAEFNGSMFCSFLKIIYIYTCRGVDNLLSEECGEGPLLQLPSFRVQCIRWDGMHIVNLGVDLWVCASVIRKVMEYEVELFGSLALEESDRLMIAYGRFREWTRANRIVCLSLFNMTFIRHH